MIHQREITYEYLSLALDVGERILKSGGEVSRVEDTITRICKAYGMERVDVFTITGMIVATVKGESFGTITQTRRILEQSYDLHRLERLNQLSREICKSRPAIDQIQKALACIDQQKGYRLISQMMIYALVAGSFTALFGGTASDVMASALIGVILRLAEEPMRHMKVGRIFTVFFLMLLAGLLSELAVTSGAAQHADLITTGDIMPFIPGLALTNAIRDMFQGDTVTGLTRLSEAILMSIIVVLGALIGAVLH